jgi:hypothetical protein
MGPIRCPETSVKYYTSTLRYTAEERNSHQHRGGRLTLHNAGYISPLVRFKDQL